MAEMDIPRMARLALLVALAVSAVVSCKAPRGTAPTEKPEVAAPTVSLPPATPATPAPPAPGTPTKEPAADPVHYSGAFPASGGYATLKLGGASRRVHVHLPAGRRAHPALVVVFHGTGSNISDDAHDGAMGELGIHEVADANGFVVVAPFSTSDGGVNADHEGGGDGWRFDGDAASNVDLRLTRASIQEARRAYGVDGARVYLVGHSNGAFFAYFAAMKLPERVAAFAESSGGLIACGKRVDCEYARARATSCDALLKGAPSACKCPMGPASFPTLKPPGRVPRGFLKHNADDSTVSAVFTCRLGEHLGSRAQLTLDGTGEHGPTNDFMAKAWAFLSTKSLAD